MSNQRQNVAKLVVRIATPVAIVIKIDESCIKNDGFCIEIDEFRIDLPFIEPVSRSIKW